MYYNRLLGALCCKKTGLLNSNCPQIEDSHTWWNIGNRSIEYVGCDKKKVILNISVGSNLD